MHKILIIITTAFVPTGGLTTVMMNYYRKLNKEGLQIDFASTNEAPSVLSDELAQNGSIYYNLNKRSHLLTYFIKLYSACKKYNIVHINSNSATAALELLAAKLAGVKKRIVHNHNSKTEHPYINAMMFPLFKRLYTISIACSKDAGNWLFGKDNFIVLRNAIDTDKFKFNSLFRETYRKEWNIPSNSFVIGHVGKYNAQKNHQKLLEIFYEYQKKHTEARLLCVGYGPLRNELEKTIIQLNLQGKVILTGERTDIPGFLSAMDVFVFPSLWEGLPLSVVEAFASGLPCVLSNRISQEVHLCSNMCSLSIEDSSSMWAETIDKLDFAERGKRCEQNIQSITDAGYNITTETERLRQLYIK